MRLNQYETHDEASTVPTNVRARYEQHEDLDHNPERALAWNHTTRVLIDAISQDMITCLGHQVAPLPGRRVTVDRERLRTLLHILDAGWDESLEDGDRVTFYVEPGAPLALKRPGAGWCLLLAPLVAARKDDDETPTVATQAQPEGS